MEKRSWLVFFAGAAFVLLLYHACGALAPYRDAGEFALAARYLTITHPPGYSFYTILARAWALLFPLGTEAYRLNVLSSLATALALVFGIFWIGRFAGVSYLSALSAMVLFSSSRLVLGLSFVSEMYTVGLLFLLVLLICLHQALDLGQSRRLLMMCLLFPLALGTRLDLVLSSIYVLPFLGLLFRPHWRRHWPYGLFFLLIGFTVFLYLPIRSVTEPLVNWGDPSSWPNLLAALMRKSHGSTLDLLSKEYKLGSMFFLDCRHWARVAWEGFGPALAFVPAGLIFLRARRSSLFWPSLLCFFVNGPVFLFLANMPPNPHALKVLEDHFLPSLLMLALWIACGLQFTAQQARARLGLTDRAMPAGAGIILGAGLLIFLGYRSAGAGLRRNFYLYDYAVNVFRSAPPGAIVVLHEDVQLFGLWYEYWRRGHRKDLRLVAQGLSGSPWYLKSLRERWGYTEIALAQKLTSSAAWESFVRSNNSRPVMLGFETDPFGAPLNYLPHGLLSLACAPQDEACALRRRMTPWPHFTLRGKYKYEEENFFFNSDLINDYARAAHVEGRWLLGRGEREKARAQFNRALSLELSYPQPSSYLAFLEHGQNNMAGAAWHWERARQKYYQMLELGRRYRSLPDALGSLGQEFAYTLTSLGAAYERLGRSPEDTMALHQEAVHYDPNSIQARYNLAAVFWHNKRYEEAGRELEATLRLDPNHAEAQKYLSLLKSRR